MPILANQQHEAYAQALASGHNAHEAYELAGYKPDAKRGNATRLKANKQVRARVKELQLAAAERTEITIASLTAMYLDDRRRAHEINQLSVAKGAVDSIAKLHGLMVERNEHTGKDGSPLPAPIITVNFVKPSE